MLFPEDKSFVAVVFPTSDKLKNIQTYAKEAERPLLIVNPQWNQSAQVSRQQHTSWGYVPPSAVVNPHL